MNKIGILLTGHGYYNDVQTMVQAFYPHMSYTPCEEKCFSQEQAMVVESVLNSDGASCLVHDKQQILANVSACRYRDNDDKHNVKLAVYYALQKLCPTQLQWGTLTGIRPAKKVTEYFNNGLSEQAIRDILQNRYLVEDTKINLAIEVSKKEQSILQNGKSGDSYSLYVGIPFCPAKCLYCSFTSYPVQKHTALIPDYVKALCKEIKEISEITRGKQLQTVYIGGGTPTALKASELFLIFEEILKDFDCKSLQEFTVEAGRPDTLDQEKLRLMKDYNVSRISINPQTMNEKTLAKIGRNHSISDIQNVYNLAREIGFDNINMDTILALPGEDCNDVENTYRQLAKMAPDSITVHTLAVKRASALKEDTSVINATAQTTQRMLEIADTAVRGMGQQPYYMYRQKNSVGNFENVGYAREGCECLYNVLIMEECQSIYAAGAGSVTKRVDHATNRIERDFHVKNVEEYIKRIDGRLLYDNAST